MFIDNVNGGLNKVDFLNKEGGFPVRLVVLFDKIPSAGSDNFNIYYLYWR
jgi:hypothetical protein